MKSILLVTNRGQREEEREKGKGKEERGRGGEGERGEGEREEVFKLQRTYFVYQVRFIFTFRVSYGSILIKGEELERKK